MRRTAGLGWGGGKGGGEGEEQGKHCWEGRRAVGNSLPSWEGAAAAV